MIKRATFLITTVLFVGVLGLSIAQPPTLDDLSGYTEEEYQAYLVERTAGWHERELTEAFKGVTTNGEIVPNLFSVRSTGVSTEPVRIAAEAYLATLNAEQRARTLYPVDDEEWRKWMNIHSYLRQGVRFRDLTDGQRGAAMGLLQASLSAKGLKLSEDIMKLNATLGELNGDDFIQYGDDQYTITIMGTPSATEPWGWQMDGHHLVINYFVLGDQVVMTPAFWGSEPVLAASGRYAGTWVLQEEQDKGLQMLHALDESQQAQAVLNPVKDTDYDVAAFFRDNLELDYTGVSVSTFSELQRMQLMELIGLYVGNLRDDHAAIRMSEVAEHLDDTYFAWIGGNTDETVYYYRIQSPVILIEFDHQTPIGLTHLHPRGVPYRGHIHTTVRTPNGNDYGKDLLRQHYAMHPH
jgi:hypothetical protein